MDNQHDLNSLAYLGGFTDGDGCIRLSVINAKGYKVIIPSVELCNTNEAIIEYCGIVLQQHGVKYNQSVNNKTGGKPYHVLTLRSQPRCKKMLELTKPYLIEKKHKAGILIDFINWRHKSSRKYTDTDWKYVKRFRDAQAPIASTSYNLGYLAGLLDAEGSISLKGGYSRKHKKLASISPSVRFTNTNQSLVNHVVGFFKKLGSNPHVFSKTLDSGKVFWDVTVNGLAKTKRVLSKIDSMLVGKRGQASIVLDFINHRLSLSKAGSPKTRYTDYELGLVYKVQSMNR